MTELYFLRHGIRIDHAQAIDPNAKPLYPDYKPYDPSLAELAVDLIDQMCEEISNLTNAFTPDSGKKTVYIHFSPYLRCCQTADLMVTFLKQKFEKKFSNWKTRYQLLGDFALSEWLHERMKDKPPFYDSNDAYQMYTPNVKLLKNRSACSNFRPTNTLGHYNGYDLSYKDYQNNCKEYFKKLLATYDKPSHIRNKDIVVVVSHGYLINNLLSYFVTHPIFDEIPEAKVNFARRIDINQENEEEDSEAPKSQWVLVKDALDMFDFEAIDKTLNLETDIVYYKTNFIKRDELNQKNNDLTIKMEDNPRPSFKIHQTSKASGDHGTKDNHNNSNITNNPICPAARDWTPQDIRKFEIRNEFKLKAINDSVFKKPYDITKAPSHPVSPEVSPSSEPTRNNSVIDLSKMVTTDKNYKPMKLKYSTTDEIPIEQLNKKINSQVNLAQHQRSYPSSNNSSVTDFPKFSSSAKRKDYFLSQSPKISSTFGDESNMEVDSMESEQDKKTRPPPNPLISRSRSLKYKEEQALNSGRSLLALYQKSQQQESSEDETNGNFTLLFNNKVKPNRTVLSTSGTSPTQIPGHRSRKNSLKFVPSVLGYESLPMQREPDREGGTSTPVGMYRQNTSIFYNLDSDSDLALQVSSEDEKDENEIHMWFGKNRS